MKSSLPKVLHKIAGLPLICHVIKQIELAGVSQLAVVVGFGAKDVVHVVESFVKNAMILNKRTFRNSTCCFICSLSFAKRGG